MKRKIAHLFIAAIVALLLAVPLSHAGGTPLICHPYAIGDAEVLPLGHDFHGCTKSYARKNLTSDTLALLTPQRPVIVRMEILRQAVIYAAAEKLNWTDYADYQPSRVDNLLTALRQRVASATESGRALARFDLGFFLETLRQGNVAVVDGYADLVKANELRGGDPEIEFALALTCARPHRAEMNDHLARAHSAAKPNTLLAENLPRHFGPTAAVQ